MESVEQESESLEFLTIEVQVYSDTLRCA